MSADHRAHRRAQLARHARDGGLDGVLVHSWRRQTVGWLAGYSPGFVTNSATLWIGADGDQRLGVRFPFDLDRAAGNSGLPVLHAATPTSILPPGVTRIGLVAGDIAINETTVSLVTALHEAEVEYVDLREVVDDLQEIKLPGEIVALRHAGEVAGVALDTWGLTAPVGTTDYQLAAAIEATARGLGARLALCLVGVGAGAVVSECRGVQIAAADAVGLELTVYVDEWCMHVNTQLRTAEPNADNDHVQKVCIQARGTMLAAMRPGIAIDEIVAAGDAVLAAAGLLHAKEYDFGHGLAGDTPAHPRLVSGTGRLLQENTVTALHVAVRVPSGPTGFVGGPVLVTGEGAVELNPDAVWAGPRRTTCTTR